jgi:seryl-tRNA synthetase
VTIAASHTARIIGRWIKPSEIKAVNDCLQTQDSLIGDLMGRLARAERTIVASKKALDEAKKESNALRTKLSDESRRAKREAEGLRNRIKVALAELHGGDAHAIVLSPKQVEHLTWNAQSLSCGRGKVGKIDGVQVYVARGVSGPLVLNRDAFAAFSRQAPEMDIRTA